ncbi:MAG: hypothetical protein NPMRTH1_400008 [Nitrosopumilales archaeon]|nr:MAG: hypothetical protein NPMRTH1_400008 [Nitrosopumilales archaeon]
MKNKVKKLRLTIMLDSDLQTRLRKKQIRKLSRSQEHYSLSRCLNDVLRDGW